jgi:hypothetical protein
VFFASFDYDYTFYGQWNISKLHKIHFDENSYVYNHFESDFIKL